jgi:hypothetical protein
MADDRRTTIYGDQIKDYSLGADELNTQEIAGNRRKWMTLTYKDNSNGQMRWAFLFGNKILK